MGDNNDPKKPDTAPSTAVLDASYETLILTLDLVGTETSNITSRLTQAIQDLNFQQEVESFLNAYAQKLLQQKTTGKALSASGAGQIALETLEDSGKKIGQEIGKDVLNQIESSRKFLDLKEQLTKLGKEFTDRPIGVWFTDGKAYIIAAGLLINGAALVFVTSLGVKKIGMPTVLSALEGKTVSVKPFGSLELGTGIAKVDQKAGIVDLKITGTKEWQSIKLTMDVVGHASMKNLTRIEGAAADAKVAVAFDKNIKLNLTAGVDMPRFDQKSILYDLEAKLEISPDKGNFGLSIGAVLKGEGGKRPDLGATLGFRYDW